MPETPEQNFDAQEAQKDIIDKLDGKNDDALDGVSLDEISDTGSRIQEYLNGDPEQQEAIKKSIREVSGEMSVSEAQIYAIINQEQVVSAINELGDDFNFQKLLSDPKSQESAIKLFQGLGYNIVDLGKTAGNEARGLSGEGLGESGLFAAVRDLQKSMGFSGKNLDGYLGVSTLENIKLLIREKQEASTEQDSQQDKWYSEMRSAEAEFKNLDTQTSETVVAVAEDSSRTEYSSDESPVVIDEPEKEAVITRDQIDQDTQRAAIDIEDDKSSDTASELEGRTIKLDEAFTELSDILNSSTTQINQARQKITDTQMAKPAPEVPTAPQVDLPQSKGILMADASNTATQTSQITAEEAERLLMKDFEGQKNKPIIKPDTGIVDEDSLRHDNILHEQQQQRPSLPTFDGISVTPTRDTIEDPDAKSTDTKKEGVLLPKQPSQKPTIKRYT